MCWIILSVSTMFLSKITILRLIFMQEKVASIHFFIIENKRIFKHGGRNRPPWFKGFSYNLYQDQSQDHFCLPCAYTCTCIQLNSQMCQKCLDICIIKKHDCYSDNLVFSKGPLRIVNVSLKKKKKNRNCFDPPTHPKVMPQMKQIF